MGVIWSGQWGGVEEKQVHEDGWWNGLAATGGLSRPNVVLEIKMQTEW